MLSVAICDDEPAVCREIEELLAGQLVRADLDGNTRVFSDGESLVRAYERGEADFQIVFLDIKMQAMNGISAAREIRRYDEKVLIVFITSSAEYVFRGYEVKAFRYILKTELHQAFRKIFEECMEELRADSLRRFSFRLGADTVTLDLWDILYFESNRRQITVHVKTEQYTFYGKLDDIEQELKGQDFVRCHQSFLVNAKQIKIVGGNALTLLSGETLPVSKSRREAVRDASLWAMR